MPSSSSARICFPTCSRSWIENPFRADAKVVHIDLNAYDIAKNHPITLGLVSDPKPTLRLLAARLTEQMTEAQKAGARVGRLEE